MAPRLPRVVHVTTAAEFVQNILIHDLRRLRNRTEATIVCADGPGLDDVRAEGFRVVTIPIERKLTPVADLRALWHLWRLLRRERFDLLHSYVPKGGLIGQCAGWLAGVPRRMHSCRGLLYTPTMHRGKRMLFRRTDRLTNTLAHRTIFISRADYDHSTGNSLCDLRRARFTGSGIDLSYFDPRQLSPTTRREVRERLGIANDAPLILTVGRFVVDKGYRELAEAVKALRRAHPSAHFVWIAPLFDGEDGVVNSALLDVPELQQAVTRLEVQNDLRPFYAAADVLAHPSYREGVPRVLMEAAAMGLPIVASDIPGCREVVTDGAKGLLCAPKDANALASALETVLNDPTSAAVRADAALAKVHSDFDQDRLTDRIWRIYLELLESSESPTASKPVR